MAQPALLEEHAGHGDAQRRADVANHAEQALSHAHLAGAEDANVEGRNGRGNAQHADAVEHDVNNQHANRRQRRNRGKHVEDAGERHQAADDQNRWPHQVGKPSDEDAGHGRHGERRHDGQAGLQRRQADHLLQKDRHHELGAEQAQAVEERRGAEQAERGPPEQPQVDRREGRRQFAQDKAAAAQQRPQPQQDEHRRLHVRPPSQADEHQQGNEEAAQADQAEVIDRLAPVIPVFRNDQPAQQGRQHAGRDAQQKEHPPRELLHQVAAGGERDDLPRRPADRAQPQSGAALARRKRLHQDDGGQPFHRPGGAALDQPANDQNRQVGGKAAAQAGNDERHQHGHKQVAVAHDAAEPAEDRRDQGAGNQEAGGDPLGGRQVGAEGGHEAGNGEVDAVAGKRLRAAGQQNDACDQPLV